MKWYNVKISNVTIIGDFPYFENTDQVEICDLGFGKYRGIQVKKEIVQMFIMEKYIKQSQKQ